MASAGVATRAWSSPFVELLAAVVGALGLTPGTTMRNSLPQARRMALASWAEATTPSSPACRASRASFTALTRGGETRPTCRIAALSRLVRTVTASSMGLAPLTERFSALPRAWAAVRIISSPPRAWRLIRRTPGKSAAAETAPATVLGMSWNLRSRKMPAPRRAIFLTAAGPSAANNWLPILNISARPDRRWASL